MGSCFSPKCGFLKACVKAVERKGTFPNISPTSGRELKKGGEGVLQNAFFFAHIFLKVQRWIGESWIHQV